MLERRSRQEKMHKLSMAVGAFFSEGGSELRRRLLAFEVDTGRGDLGGPRSFPLGKRDVLLRLLGNPNLLEHESCTDALWSAFHRAEGLEHRADLARLSRSDLGHLSGDMRRGSAALAVEWTDHARHLKGSCPHLPSLAVRRDALDRGASAEFADAGG